MGLSGNLSTMSLAEILQWLSIGQKTGTLQILGADITKKVFFREGKVASSSSSDPKELVGQFLISSNKLTERQLKVALEMQVRDQSKLGTVLLQQNILTKDELMDILRQATEEVIYDLFLWEAGEFEFLDGALPEDIPLSFGMDVTHLILEGVRRSDEWGRIKSVFPDGSTVLRPNVEQILQNMPLHANEERLLRLLDGERTLDALALEVRATKFNLCKGLLDLYEANLIEVGDFKAHLIPSSGTRGEVDPIERLVQSIEGAIRRGQLDQADSMLVKLRKAVPDHPQLKPLDDACKERRLETTAKQMIKIDRIPVLSMSVDAITRLPLSPEEGFIVSRVNGIWDVKSIMKIAPFGETVALRIFKKFLDDGVIKFK